MFARARHIARSTDRTVALLCAVRAGRQPGRRSRRPACRGRRRPRTHATTPATARAGRPIGRRQAGRRADTSQQSPADGDVVPCRGAGRHGDDHPGLRARAPHRASAAVSPTAGAQRQVTVLNQRVRRQAERRLGTRRRSRSGWPASTSPSTPTGTGWTRAPSPSGTPSGPCTAGMPTTSTSTSACNSLRQPRLGDPARRLRPDARSMDGVVIRRTHDARRHSGPLQLRATPPCTRRVTGSACSTRSPAVRHARRPGG